MSIKVLINGAHGRMGKVTVIAVEQCSSLELVGTIGRNDDLAKVIKQTTAKVVVDFTNAESVFENTKTIITTGAYPVVGSSGLLPEQIKELQQLAKEKQVGGIIAPNFCIGAVLMMQFAEQAAKYFSQAEVIEFHHDKKLDAPSGTAIKTAEMIANKRQNEKVVCNETLQGARGAVLQGVPLHSIRLKGLLAHQEVLLGGEGELLTLRHDSFKREAFMPGVCLACEKVVHLNELVYGLENIL